MTTTRAEAPPRTLSHPSDEIHLRFPTQGELRITALRTTSLVDRQAAAALASSMAIQAGFSARRARELAIVVSELVENMVIHADGGRLELAIEPSTSTMRVRAMDDGKGIGDLLSAFLDGHTDGRALLPEEAFRRGGIGCGLGAVQRLSDELHVVSSHQGTRVTVYFEGPNATPKRTTDASTGHGTTAPEHAVLPTC